MASPPPTTTPNPTTTKAWTYSHRALPRQALTLNPSHPVPPFPPASPPTPDEELVLLTVAYAALNPGDVVTMAVLPPFIRSGPARTAAVPCYDLTATVQDVYVPAGTEPRFAKGDEVIGFVTFDYMRATGVGGLQGVVVVPARFVVRLPKGKTLREAAGLLLTGCTAMQMVSETGVEKGWKVLVVGASGGVGTAVTQIAREVVGAEGKVVAVCSGRNKEMVEGLGADEVIDYTQHKDLAGELTSRYGEDKFDVVLDAHGNQTLFNYCAGFLKEDGVYDAASVQYDGYNMWEILKSGMRLLLNGIWPKSTWLGGTGRTWKAVSMFDPGVEMMKELATLFGEGKLRVIVDSEWPFEQVLDGYDVLISKRAKGKVIVKVGEN